MNQPSEQAHPVIYCCSSIHKEPPYDEDRTARWFVDFENEKNVPYCSSCHFLLVRAGTISSDRRIPSSTLVRNLPANLTPKELFDAVEECKKEADELGYWSPDRQFFDILNVDGVVRVTFRRT